MPIKFACHQCSKSIKCDESLSGKTAKCPDCGAKIRIPVSAFSKDGSLRDLVAGAWKSEEHPASPLPPSAPILPGTSSPTTEHESPETIPASIPSLESILAPSNRRELQGWLIIGLLVMLLIFAIRDSFVGPTGKWEYMVHSASDKDFTDTANLWGGLGWEIVSARRALDSQNEGRYELILRKPVGNFKK